MIREATELFLDEFARWLKEVPEKKPEEEIVEKLCDGVDHLFHTPPERIGKMIPNGTRERQEARLPYPGAGGAGATVCFRHKKRWRAFYINSEKQGILLCTKLESKEYTSCIASLRRFIRFHRWNRNVRHAILCITNRADRPN